MKLENYAMRCPADGSYAGPGLKPGRPDPGGCRPAPSGKNKTE